MQAKIILGLSIVLFLIGSISASAGKNDSRFVIGGHGYKLDRSDSIVIVYTHGSRGDQKRDPCIFTVGRHFLGQYFGSFRIPRVMERMSVDDVPIAIFYVCHREIGDSNALHEEARKKIPCRNTGGNPIAKFCKRKQKIHTEVEKIMAANPNLVSSRIILTGASSGAWTSMMLYGEKPNLVGGVIAFAPATNGKLGKEIDRANGTTHRKKRKCGPGSPQGETIPQVPSASRYFRHQCQKKYIAKKIPSALVFSIEGDPFNPPSLLREFRNVPNRIKFHSIARSKCGIGLPWASHPHACYQKLFFENEFATVIKNYISKRIHQ